LRLLLTRGAVFLVQVLESVLPFGRHLGVQLERLEMQLRRDAGRHALERRLE
jgi:hypothetical protein